MSNRISGTKNVLAAFWERVGIVLHETFATKSAVSDIVEGTTPVAKSENSNKTNDICIGTCATASDDPIKVVKCNKDFTLTVGRHLLVSFLNDNTASNVKIDTLDGSGAHSVIIKNSANKPMGTGAISQYANVEFVYNGSVWIADTDIVEKVETDTYGYTVYANGNISQHVTKLFQNVDFSTQVGNLFTSDDIFNVDFPMEFPNRCNSVSISSQSAVDYGLIVGGVATTNSSALTKIFRLTSYSHDVVLYVSAEGC